MRIRIRMDQHYYLNPHYSEKMDPDPDPGLAIQNPPKKTQKNHLKKPTKNIFWGVF
jgi:hypothetical protein